MYDTKQDMLLDNSIKILFGKINLRMTMTTGTSKEEPIMTSVQVKDLHNYRGGL